MRQILSSFEIPADPSQFRPIPAYAHEPLLSLFFEYLAVGGMPEAVVQYKKKGQTSQIAGLLAAREVQKELILGYEADFSKYSGTVNANHIHWVYRSIPKQLALSLDESSSKYKFTGVIPKQKGFERLIGPLSWLLKSRLCIRSNLVHHIDHPLQAHTTDNEFKVFMMDVGLLNAMLDTPMEAIIRSSGHLSSDSSEQAGLGNYKGYLVENFVAQELYSIFNQDLISWKASQSEIEFLVVKGKDIIPLEVKSSARTRRAKSLDSYVSKYRPRFAYKLSAQNIGSIPGRFTTLPLYLVRRLLI